MKLYRLLTGEDSSAFCHKVSQALADGWELYGSPSYAYDANKLAMCCAQAVTKDVPGNYHPDMKLGEQ